MNERCLLPNPYPDELLYSVITRYHLRSNNSSPKWTLREVFGTENVIPTVDLPSHLEELSRRNILQEISSDQWIEKHTFYPFYTPFLPEVRSQRLRQLMKSSDGSGIHALVGITASTIERSNELRFCFSCYEDDIRTFGEPYWHRIHQLPGVWVCPTHRMILYRITHPIYDRHGLTVLPISKGMFHSAPIAVGISDKILCRLFDIACDMQLLIQTDEVPVLYDSKFTLLPRLSELGYVTAGARIRQQKLKEQFTGYYGQELLKILNSPLNESDWTWLTFVTRSARWAIHPLRQMLFIRFLYGSFNEFLSYTGSTYAPFGRSPWPCLNKAAEHYKELTIEEYQITRCTDTGRPVGTFSCKCGFVYSRRGPDQSKENSFHRGRIKSFGSIWSEKLQECLAQGLSYRQSAEILGVDTNTVIKYAKGAPINQQTKSSMPQQRLKSLPSPRTKGSNKPRVDWEKRDLELSWRVEETCKMILSDDSTKPLRISVAAIGKRIGKLSWLEKNKRKLPITMGLMDKYLESFTQFQVRRVRWAAGQLVGEWPLKRWKLEKKAGLKLGYSIEVHEELERSIGNSKIGTSLTSFEVTGIWVH